MKQLLRLTCATVLALAIAAPAMGANFCSDYGISCYKPYQSPGRWERGFVKELWGPGGDYMGGIRLEHGQTCSFVGCEPVDEKLRKVDWDAVCNMKYVECEGKCFSR